MWLPMSNPLANPTTPPKPVLGITQDEIVIDHEEPFDEDDDFFARKHNPRMPRIVFTKNPYHGRKSRPSHTKMLVGFLLVDGLHLLATMVVDLLTMVVMDLQEVVMVVL
jgi:hypothetical protein